MNKKLLILSLILVMSMMLSGCYTSGTSIYFEEPIPELSFKSYRVSEEEKTKEKDTDGDGKPDTIEVTGYKYIISGNIINKGHKGKYVISVTGQKISSTTWEDRREYGPVYIEVGEASFNLEYAAGVRYKNFKIKLYSMKDNGERKLQAEVQYKLNS